jgi:hypothetical protein
VSSFRFYRCQKVRCPHCGLELKFLKAKKGEPLLLQHPKAPGCLASEKKFYAAPLVVELEEFK